jgi:soluble lytic murein transglycosylase
MAATVLAAASAQACHGPATTAGDQTMLEMQPGPTSKGDRARSSNRPCCQQVRGHLLEPWAAYWDTARAPGPGVRAAKSRLSLQRYAGTYQEDRLRNDWLLLLGQRRDWDRFAEQHPSLYRMSDDPEVRCYAVLVDALKLARRPECQALADDGAPQQLVCPARRWTTAALTRRGSSTLPARLSPWTSGARPAWRWRPTARVPCAHAVDIVSPDADCPAGSRQRAATPRPVTCTRAPQRGGPDEFAQRKELVALALIKSAWPPPTPAAAQQLETTSGAFMLAPEERNWVWGVIGRQRRAKLLAPQAGHLLCQRQRATATCQRRHAGLEGARGAARRDGRSGKQVLNKAVSMP